MKWIMTVKDLMEILETMGEDWEVIIRTGKMEGTMGADLTFAGLAEEKACIISTYPME